MHSRAALLIAVLLPLLAACGGRAAPEFSVETAYARLPDEIAGFRKIRPEDTARSIVARYAHPNHSAGSVHTLAPARAGTGDAEVGAAMEILARATVTEATAQRENATLRHFMARAAETGPVARCLDVQLRGEFPRRQLGCAVLLEGRVFLVMMIAPEAVDGRRGLRDPLLAVAMRLIGALSGTPPEILPVEEALPEPPEAAPPAPPRPAPRPRPQRQGVGPTWRT
ncbi:hypothetical protein [Roseomonas xinghualingensis]|uniref:hypothetical protein n=1 Tax=Roseomonas xinghualingensis TaxID=2986475 RepID=UPI0021F15EC1|nr:hypothetical protein [Roseomonas sp. SXEYE001]MCV4207650.1 hypothetical protein [Roseomonas sp. SXEYE001]